MKHIFILLIFYLFSLCSCKNKNMTPESLDLSKNECGTTVKELYQVAINFPTLIPQELELRSAYIIRFLDTHMGSLVVLDDVYEGCKSDSLIFAKKVIYGTQETQLLFKILTIDSCCFIKAFVIEEADEFSEIKFINGQKKSLVSIDGCFVTDSTTNYIFYINTRFSIFASKFYGNHKDITRIIACDNSLFPKLIFHIHEDSLMKISEIQYNRTKDSTRYLTKEVVYDLQNTEFCGKVISDFKFKDLLEVYNYCKGKVTPKYALPNSLSPFLPLWMGGGEYLHADHNTRRFNDLDDAEVVKMVRKYGEYWSE